MTYLISTGDRAFTAKEFQGLAEIPPEVEWFANFACKIRGVHIRISAA